MDVPFFAVTLTVYLSHAHAPCQDDDLSGALKRLEYLPLGTRADPLCVAAVSRVVFDVATGRARAVCGSPAKAFVSVEVASMGPVLEFLCHDGANAAVLHEASAYETGTLPGYIYIYICVCVCVRACVRVCLVNVLCLCTPLVALGGSLRLRREPGSLGIAGCSSQGCNMLTHDRCKRRWSSRLESYASVRDVRLVSVCPVRSLSLTGVASKQSSYTETVRCV
jgi:hypothetical protein